MPAASNLLNRFNQLDAVCENATVALFAMDDRQHCVYMNRAAELLTGFTLADVQGRPLHEFVHHTHPDGSPFPIEDCPIDRAAPQNMREQGEAMFVHRDGHFYPVAFTASPVRRDGAVIGTVIEVRSIEDERRHEAEQQAMRELADLLLREVRLETISQAVIDTGTRLVGAQFGAFFHNVMEDGRERMMLHALSGARHEQFAGMPMPRATQLFRPTFSGEGTVLVGDVLSDPRYAAGEGPRGMPHGHLPVRSYLATSVLSDQGEVLGSLLFGHPEPHRFDAHHAGLAESLAAQAALGVSRARLFRAAEVARDRAEAEAREKARLYQEATRANQMKDLFLATVSHELRTPLTSILGWSDMLASGRLDAERSRAAVTTIARNARAQAQIVEDLLDISRIVSGKLQLDIRTVSPAAVVEAAVDSVRPAALARGIALELRFAADAGQVAADADRLQQIVWNLLTNAVKFTDRGGRVTVCVDRVGAHVEIHVSDTGRGIEPDFLPQLFDRFSQRDSSSTREHGGLGLGLAIVRQLVEMHGGTVHASSAGTGQGAHFVVRLPVGAAEREAVPSVLAAPACDEDPRPDGLPDLSGSKVLLVEDDADSRELLATVFRSRHADVRSCASVAEALEAVEAFAPDIIVSDIGMPGADGYDFIRALRAREVSHGRPSIPAIALSAYAQAADRMRALASGFQMHVAKPVHPAELLAVAASLLGWQTRAPA
ncbi:MAG TPA: ATP-binding protein [Lysobacter sp.]